MCLRRCKNQNFNMTFSFLSIKNLKTDILVKPHVMASGAWRSNNGSAGRARAKTKRHIEIQILVSS